MTEHGRLRVVGTCHLPMFAFAVHFTLRISKLFVAMRDVANVSHAWMHDSALREKSFHCGVMKGIHGAFYCRLAKATFMSLKFEIHMDYL